MKSGIYKITNLINGKFYIGSSNNIEKRWYDHKRNLKNLCHPNQKLQNSWNFYGEDKFSFEIIEETLPEKIILLEKEQHYLDLFKPYMRDIGYNICETAAGGDNITNNPNREQFLEKMSVVCSGENNPMFGKKHTTETKKLQSEKASGRFTLNWFIQKHGENEGKIKYDERRISLQNRNINYIYSNNRQGKIEGPMTNENKQKISNSKKRLKITKSFLLKDIESNLFSVKELSIKYETSIQTIKYYKKKLKNKLI